jgi:hypothetical protein
MVVEVVATTLLVVPVGLVGLVGLVVIPFA